MFKISYWPAEATSTRRTVFESIVIVIVIARMTMNDDSNQLKWSIRAHSGTDSRQWDWGIRKASLNNHVRVYGFLL